MFSANKLKGWMNWEVVRGHWCTLSVSLGLANWWAAPREAYRYGALSWALAAAMAAAAVALPLALLHLAVGQLGRHDAVDMWQAVPFFKGIGYLRLMISFLAALYTSVYLAIIMTYLLRTIFNLTSYWACAEQVVVEFNESISYNILDSNETSCLNEILTEPFSERPEFYLGLALVIIALWFAFPFILYSPIKMLKRVYYILGPVMLILVVVIVSCIGDKEHFLSFQETEDWRFFLVPDFWYSCITHALWSSQIAGGLLVSAGGTIYSNMNVQWTALIFIVVNVLSTWCGLCFWSAVGGRGQPTTFAVLVQIHNTVGQKGWSRAWSALTCLTLILSGIITMLALLYPLYDRFRRVGGHRWRMWSIGNSVVGIAATLAMLTGRLTTLDLVERYAVPFLAILTTVIEIMAFVIIYGWRNLEEDIAFLTEHERGKLWIGWCLSVCVLSAFTGWWTSASIANDAAWTDGPWVTVTIIAAAALVFFTVLVIASLTVAKQDQYDCIGKLMSSFKPSRHWGPRDPITHYAWLSRRIEVERGNPQPAIHRRQLGQLSGRPVPQSHSPQGKRTLFTIDTKRRNHSDDYVYIEYRKKCLDKTYLQFLENKFRSKSLD